MGSADKASLVSSCVMDKGRPAAHRDAWRLAAAHSSLSSTRRGPRAQGPTETDRRDGASPQDPQMSRGDGTQTSGPHVSGMIGEAKGWGLLKSGAGTGRWAWVWARGASGLAHPFFPTELR